MREYDPYKLFGYVPLTAVKLVSLQTTGLRLPAEGQHEFILNELNRLPYA